MFRAHFLAPSSCQEVSSAFLNRAAQSPLQNSRTPLLLHVSEERPYGLSRLCAGLRLRLPVYPNLPLRRLSVATGLEDDDWDGMGG